jgi:nucleoside-diphosphate-sugar epimerase
MFMKVIMTGATGFIGKALCEELHGRGFRVTAIVGPGSKNLSRLPGYVKTIELCLDNVSRIQGEYDVFYHLAWNGASGSDRDDFNIQSVNIAWTMNMLRLAKRLGCKRFIGAGSQAEYGRVRGLCNENTATNPFMMYGKVKLDACNKGSVLARQLGLEFVWPRIYSVYGVGESRDTVLSYVLDSLMQGKQPELSLCDNMWDFLYVTDCARALADLGDLKKSLHGIYNVSYGSPRLLSEFIQDVVEIVNPGIKPLYGVKEVDENKTFWLEPDVSKLKAIPFTPEIDFRQGIKMKYESMKSGG